MRKANTHAVMRADEYGLFTGHQFGGNEFVIIRYTHGDNASGCGVAERVERCLLDLAVSCGHKYRNGGIKVLDG